MRERTLAALLLPLVGGFGPCGPIPGGALSGETHEGPDPEWAALEDLESCALEVRPVEPYSVRVDCFETNGQLHVAAPGGPDKTWPRLLEETPGARVRVGERLFERRAVRLEPAHGVDPDRWLFRLDPRSASRGEGEVVIGETLRTDVKRYSQNDEELVIRDFFRDRQGGFFLDVGAWLPKKNSTTYYLEHHLGWSGIAVDALAEMGPPWAKQRPRSRFFNFIATDHSGGIETLYSAGAVSSTLPEFHDGLSLGGRKARPVQVPTITLNDLLDREGVTRIDFLSMDIEGGEPLALAGLDLERFRPELVCIETGRADRPHAVAGYFADRGYVQIAAYLNFDRINAYFTPRIEP